MQLVTLGILLSFLLNPIAWGAAAMWEYKSAILEGDYVIVTVEDTSEPDKTKRRLDKLKFDKTDTVAGIKAAITNHLNLLNARDTKADVSVTYNPR